MKTVIVILISIILILGDLVLYWTLGPAVARIDSKVQGDIEQECAERYGIQVLEE